MKKPKQPSDKIPKTKMHASGVPDERVVAGISKMARLMGEHRDTITGYVNNHGFPVLTSKPRANGTLDYEFDLMAVFSWQMERGMIHERQNPMPGSKPPTARAQPGDDGAGTWIHPRTNKTYTDLDVIAAEKAKIMADSETAQIKRDKSQSEFLKFDGRLSENEDILVGWKYYTMMVGISVEGYAADMTRVLEETGMHAEEARRLAQEPMKDVVAFLKKASPFIDPLKGEDHEADRGEPEQAEGEGSEPDPDADAATAEAAAADED